MDNSYIEIINASENNLKNISLKIPKNSLCVVTGLSGSGKSSLAFGTLYTEGQRRYIESLSSYARQFLGKLQKPKVQKINGLTPAIAIDQKSTSKNPRSTVGTITEIYDYLRLLFARIGEPHCYKCGEKISSMNESDVINQVLALPQGSKVVILAPIINRKKGSFADLFENLKSKGYVRVWVDGVIARLDEEELELEKNKMHTIKAVIDRVVVNDDNTSRISTSVEKALKESFGELEVEVLNSDDANIKCDRHIHYSMHNACFTCKISYDKLEPISFSFNSPKGACSACDGLGIRYTLDKAQIIDEAKTLNEGSVRLFYGFNKGYYFKMLEGFCKNANIDMDTPFGQLQEHEKGAILLGSATKAVFTWKRHKLTREWIGVTKLAYDMIKDDKDSANFMIEKKCDKCDGFRLNPSALSVKVLDKTISYFISEPIEVVNEFFTKNTFTHLSEQEQQIAQPILKEIKERIYFLYDVGLGYLSLGRDARSISGGEAQRIRIASQIGSGLTGVMYVLDEPSIGLHERDTFKLINTLKNLQTKGNSLIVVEHDKETILHADWIVDVGPRAGVNGGQIVFNGKAKDLPKANTLTAKYINGELDVKYFYRRAQKEWLELSGVTLNNINNLDVKIPLHNLVAITGVSGSGKSSLVLGALLPLIKEATHNYKKIKKIDGVSIKGVDSIDKVVYLDQSPIGRTPRSNPATYTGLMDDIRELFASTKEAQMMGYKIGRFSFNVAGGRCDRCGGEGEIKVQMHFLPDIMVVCESCNGARYNAQTLNIKYKTKSIYDVLCMSVAEASEFFAKHPKMIQKLKTLNDVGLGYITLGQNAITLSGGEAQRIKLSKELSKKNTSNTFYILDEPTTGLHFDDVDKLVDMLHRLTSLGNSVVVIEHNLDVIKNADYIVDMGYEGGSKGGQIISCGTPEEVASTHKQTKSYTGYYLQKELDSSAKSKDKKDTKEKEA